MAWDDSEFQDYNYDQEVDPNQDLGGYDQAGQKNSPMESPQWDSSNFWDQGSTNFNLGDYKQQPLNQSFAPNSLSDQFQQFQPEQYGMSQAPAELPNMGGTNNWLSQLFSGMGTQQGKGAISGLGALVEGYQNKKQASNMQQLVQQQQQRQSPFDTAGGSDPTSMRGQMQQALTQTMQNPYGQPMVKAQVDQIARAQAIKDAQAGRRSNTATSSPAMMAAQAKVAQEYMNSLQNPAGANIAPQDNGSLAALINAQKYGTNGYASPMLSAMGYNSGSNNNSQAMQKILEILASSKSGG